MCTRCGLVRDVEDAELDAIRPTREVTRIGRPDAVTVQFRGVCAPCQSKEAINGMNDADDRQTTGFGRPRRRPRLTHSRPARTRC